MSRLKRKTTTKKAPEFRKPLTSYLSVEERVKVIANLIVDRIMEDQINGKLRFTNQTKKQL